jgi:hypothetical protein
VSTQLRLNIYIISYRGDSGGEVNILRGGGVGHYDKHFLGRCAQLLMFVEKEIFESPHLTPLGLCFWVWMKSGVHNRKADTQDELDVAARKNKREKNTQYSHTSCTVH